MEVAETRELEEILYSFMFCAWSAVWEELKPREMGCECIRSNPRNYNRVSSQASPQIVDSAYSSAYRSLVSIVRKGNVSLSPVNIGPIHTAELRSRTFLAVNKHDGYMAAFRPW